MTVDSQLCVFPSPEFPSQERHLPILGFHVSHLSPNPNAMVALHRPFAFQAAPWPGLPNFGHLRIDFSLFYAVFSDHGTTATCASGLALVSRTMSQSRCRYWSSGPISRHPDFSAPTFSNAITLIEPMDVINGERPPSTKCFSMPTSNSRQ